MTSERVQPRRTTAAPWLLLICTGASLALYGAFFASAFPLSEYYAIPLRDLGKITEHAQDAALRFFGAFAGLFALYVLTYRIAAGALSTCSSRWRLVVLAAPLILALPLLLTYPVGAIDVYDYSFFSRMIGHYGANPMVHPPADFPGDAWLTYVAWPHAASPYGPLWQWLSALIFSIARDDLRATILAFKVVAAASLLACASLAYLILRDWRPQDALKGFVFIAWNPLLLFESAANAHNDAVMTAFVLFALWLQQRRKRTLAIVVLVLAAFVKFPAVIVLPIFALATLRTLTTWRERIRWLLVTSLASLAVATLIYLPVAAGPNPFSNLSSHQNLFTTSFAALGVFAARAALGLAPAQTLALLSALFVLSGALVWILLSLDGTLPSLARATYLALFALLTIATIWFQPWYLVWLLALAPLAPHGARAVAGLFSASVLAVYLVYDFALFWAPWFFGRDDGLTLNLVTVSLVFGPPLIVLASRAFVIRLRAPRRTAGWSIERPDQLVSA